MKLYKLFLISVLFLVSVGSVCATDPDNTTHTNLTDNQKVNNGLDNIITTCNLLKEDNAKQAIEIQNLKDNNTQLDKRVKTLENSSAEKDVRINELNNTVNGLKIDNEALKDNNTQLNKRVKILEDSNKVLNTTVNNQAVKINELNNKLELQFIEINKLQGDKDKLQADIKQLNIDIKKLNAEKCSIYEKLLSSPKKEELDQLKKDIDNKNKDIANKDKQINELNTQIDNLNKEIKTLKSIYSVSRNDVYNSLKDLSSTKNIQCGKYTFKLEDYLKIPLIREGKNNVLKFKKDNGRLPKYVKIGDYKVPQKVYKKLFNI